jgi:riboflavin transporter FmnP
MSPQNQESAALNKNRPVANPISAKKHRVFSTRNIVLIAMFGAISMILMLFDFPIPLAPGFMKFDFADLPAMLATFIMGPVEGILVCVVKLILKLIVKGTSTAFVGELANLVAGSLYMLPAYFIYRRIRSKKGAVLALAVGTLIVSIGCVFTNYYVIFPMYAKMYGMPMETIIALGTAINPKIDSLFSMMLLSVFPFNIVKYGSISLLTFLLYKRLKKVLIRK